MVRIEECANPSRCMARNETFQPRWSEECQILREPMCRGRNGLYAQDITLYFAMFKIPLRSLIIN